MSGLGDDWPAGVRGALISNDEFAKKNWEHGKISVLWSKVKGRGSLTVMITGKEFPSATITMDVYEAAQFVTLVAKEFSKIDPNRAPMLGMEQ